MEAAYSNMSRAKTVPSRLSSWADCNDTAIRHTSEFAPTASARGAAVVFLTDQLKGADLDESVAVAPGGKMIARPPDLRAIEAIIGEYRA